MCLVFAALIGVLAHALQMYIAIAKTISRSDTRSATRAHASRRTINSYTIEATPGTNVPQVWSRGADQLPSWV